LHHSAQELVSCPTGRMEPEPCRRRLSRRCNDSCPDRRETNCDAVSHSQRKALFVFCIDASRRRRPRYVRLSCGSRGQEIPPDCEVDSYSRRRFPVHRHL
jgi:hypothetical protein